MIWLSALAIVATVSGITISVVVLLAVRALKRALNIGTERQAQLLRRLIETLATLTQQQQSAQSSIRMLADDNRRLRRELASLCELIGGDEHDSEPDPDYEEYNKCNVDEGDDGTVAKAPGVPRFLN